MTKETKEEILIKHGRTVSGPALAAMDEWALIVLECMLQKGHWSRVGSDGIDYFEDTSGNLLSKHQVYSQFIEQQTKDK